MFMRISFGADTETRQCREMGVILILSFGGNFGSIAATLVQLAISRKQEFWLMPVNSFDKISRSLARLKNCLN
jgi:hypothetical protein